MSEKHPLEFDTCEVCKKKCRPKLLPMKIQDPKTRNWQLIDKLVCDECAPKPNIIQDPITERANEIISETLSLQQLMEEGPPVIEWRIQNILPKRGVLVLGATAGSYKTYLAQHLALCISTGRDFLEQFETVQCRVLYIDEENGKILLLKRFGQLKEGSELSSYPDSLFLTVFAGLKLDDYDSTRILHSIIAKYLPDVIILDSMVRLMRGGEDKAEDVRRVFDTLKTVMEDTEASFVILHHTRKGGENGMDALRGSGDFAAFADVIVMVENRGGEVRLQMVKNRHIDLSEIKPFAVGVKGDGTDWIRFEYAGLVEKQLNKTERCIEDLILWFSEGIKDFRTKDAVEWGRNKSYRRQLVQESLFELRKSKKIVRIERGHWRVKDGVSSVEENIVQ